MEGQNQLAAGDRKTTVWVPKEAFDSVMRLWKPEFNWIPVPVDRSLPPDQIAYLDTGGPVSPLPPVSRAPRTPPLPLPKTPRTPLDLPPLETALPSRSAPGGGGAAAGEGSSAGGYFGRSPELETAVTAGFSPGDTDTERPDTPSTATEPSLPATPKDEPAGMLPKPTIWRQSQVGSEYQQEAAARADNSFRAPQEEDEEEREPFTAIQGLRPDARWKMVDRRSRYRPKHENLQPASWKSLDGQRDLKMNDHWQTFKRDEAHWHGSPKGFAVRMDVNLNVELQLQGTVNGDITLSAEALYVSALLPSPCHAILSQILN